MKLTHEFSAVRIAGRRVLATNTSETKDFARELLNFLTQSQTLYRRFETATRKWRDHLKEKED
jgi:hypothetical protein